MGNGTTWYRGRCDLCGREGVQVAQVKPGVNACVPCHFTILRNGMMLGLVVRK